MDIEKLLDHMTTDPTFTDRLRTNPEAALTEAGVEPTPELIATIEENDPSEDLAARISKRFRRS